MTIPNAQSVDDELLIATLEPSLRKFFGESFRIQSLSRRLYDYHSSFAIELITVSSNDQPPLPILFKDLSPAALLDNAKLLRAGQHSDPAVEIEMYKQVLGPLSKGTAVCYASEVDVQQERHWLFLEKVPGLELYQIGDIAIWGRVAVWLAEFHSDTLRISRKKVNLPTWNDQYFGRFKTQLENSISRRANDLSLERNVSAIAKSYDRVADQLARSPYSLIHGEFYASNILVDASSDPIRICPIDWETAAFGPAVIDLAAFVSGKWNAAQRESFESKYWNALSVDLKNAFGSQAKLREDLLHARLFLAYQMLSRSHDWQPPPEHRHDWLGEAIELNAQIGI